MFAKIFRNVSKERYKLAVGLLTQLLLNRTPQHVLKRWQVFPQNPFLVLFNVGACVALVINLDTKVVLGNIICHIKECVADDTGKILLVLIALNVNDGQLLESDIFHFFFFFRFSFLLIAAISACSSSTISLLTGGSSSS